MKSMRGGWWLAWVLMAAWSGAVSGQEPVITSFPGNGQLSWTNAVNTNALYRVEWAAGGRAVLVEGMHRAAGARALLHQAQRYFQDQLLALRMP